MLHLHLIPAREKRRHIVNDGSTRTVALPRDAFFVRGQLRPFLPAVREIKSETNPITSTRELGKRGMEGREKILTERQQRRRRWRSRRFLLFRFQFPEPGPELMSGGGDLLWAKPQRRRRRKPFQRPIFLFEYIL